MLVPKMKDKLSNNLSKQSDPEALKGLWAVLRERNDHLPGF